MIVWWSRRSVGLSYGSFFYSFIYYLGLPSVSLKSSGKEKRKTRRIGILYFPIQPSLCRSLLSSSIKQNIFTK